MEINLYLFGIYIVLNIKYARCISKFSLVHFICQDCSPKNTSCCVGTVILPMVVLTTSHCAQTCNSVEQSGKTVSVLKTFHHPHYRNYVPGQVIRNDIALVHIKPNSLTRKKYVKLSAVELSSAIGLKALIPVLNSPKLKLQVTMIDHCDKEIPLYSKGYYICTTNKLLKRNKQSQCQETQGIPLFLNGKIAGVTALANRKICGFSTKLFTAVGPALSWIKSTINIIECGVTEQQPLVKSARVSKNKSAPETTTRITDALSDIKTFSTIWRDQQQQIKNINPYELVSIRNSLNKRRTTLSNWLNDVKTINEYVFENDVNSDVMKSNKLLEATTTFILNDHEEMSEIKTSYHNLENSPSATEISNLKEATEPSDVTTQDVNKLTSTDPKDPIKIATDAMNWFNNHVRNKLRQGPPPVLVLTTSVKRLRDPDFVDLT